MICDQGSSHIIKSLDSQVFLTSPSGSPFKRIRLRNFEPLGMDTFEKFPNANGTSGSSSCIKSGAIPSCESSISHCVPAVMANADLNTLDGSHFRIDIKVTPLSDTNTSNASGAIIGSSPDSHRQSVSRAIRNIDVSRLRSRTTSHNTSPLSRPGLRRFEHQLRGRTEKKLSEFGQRYSESFTLSDGEIELDPVYVKRQGMDGASIYNVVSEMLRDESGTLRDIVPKSEPQYLALFPQTHRAAVTIEHKLRDSEFTMEPPQKKNPRFSVPGVDKEKIANPSFPSEIKRANNWPPNEFLRIVGYARTTGHSDSRLVNLVLESSGVIRSRLDETNGTIIICGTGKRISDLFIVKLCTNCYKYGHTKSVCWSLRRCKFCNKNYHGSCPAKTSIERRFCSACNVSGHHVQERNCPSLRSRLDMARKGVAFKYKHIF